MKSLSRGAASLALVSMVVQVGGRFPGTFVPDAQAQSTYTVQVPQVPSSFFPYQTPTMEQIKLVLNQGMQACFLNHQKDLVAKGIASELIDTTKAAGDAMKSEFSKYRKKKKEESAGKKEPGAIACTDKGFDFKWAETDRKKFCSAPCEAPEGLEATSCDQFFSNYEGAGKKEGLGKIQALKSKYDTYYRYQVKAAEKCSGLELDELRSKMDLLKCQSGKMREAVKAAETMLGQIQAQNQRMLDELKATEGSMKGQLAEMYKVLNGTPDRPGLKVIQGFLEGEDYRKFAEDVTKAPDEEKDITLKEEQLKQELVQGKNGQFGACLSSNAGASGSGMGGQSCLDEKGQPVPCSPLQRIQAEISQQALLSGDGKVLLTGKRTQKMEAIKRAFADFAQKLMTQLGGASGKDAQGKLQPGAYSNSTAVVKVDDLMNQNSESIRQLARMSGFDLGPRLREVLKGCYNTGEEWRVREANSPAYKSKQNEVKKLRTDLNQKLDSGLQKARKVYTDTLRALGYNMDKTLDLASCSVSTLARASCAQDLNKQLVDLKAGSGASLSSVKVPAMGKIQGFVIPCRGIDGCVNALAEAKTQYETNMQQVVAQKNNLAAGANTAFDKAIKDFAAVLSGAQGSLEAAFGDMNALAAKLKVDAGELKYLESETLEPGKEGELVRPKKISEVLSANVPPKGLVDINGTGAEQVLKAAQEKASQDKKDRLDDLKSQKDQLKDLTQLGKDCIEQFDPNSKDNVGSGACDAYKCRLDLKACKESGDLSAILEALGGIAANRGKSDAIQSKFNTALNNLEGLDCVDENVKRRCSACIESKKDTWTTNQTTVDSSAETAVTK